MPLLMPQGTKYIQVEVEHVDILRHIVHKHRRCYLCGDLGHIKTHCPRAGIEHDDASSSVEARPRSTPQRAHHPKRLSLAELDAVKRNETSENKNTSRSNASAWRGGEVRRREPSPQTQ